MRLGPRQRTTADEINEVYCGHTAATSVIEGHADQRVCTSGEGRVHASCGVLHPVFAARTAHLQRLQSGEAVNLLALLVQKYEY
jgi:hypothetical protein